MKSEFKTVQAPLISYSGDEPKSLPQVVRTRDLALFLKECRLTGWEAEKRSRNLVIVEGGEWALGYRRKRKLWIKQSPLRKFPPLFNNPPFDYAEFDRLFNEQYRRWQIQMYEGLGISISSKTKPGECPRCEKEEDECR